MIMLSTITVMVNGYHMEVEVEEQDFKFYSILIIFPLKQARVIERLVYGWYRRAVRGSQRTRHLDRGSLD